MRHKMIRLAYPDLEFKEVKNPLKRVIDSGWLTKGPKTKELEDAIVRYLGVKYAVAVSSGTAALHLALLSLGIKSGDEVIVPDFTFPATANTVELCGAKAVLTDIELNDFNIDPLKIKENINRRTKAIMPVHQFGNPAEMDRIMKIAASSKLFVIEDAACALGAKYKSKMCGSIGDMGCFSFHPRKVITTGEGGVVATNKPHLAKRLRILRDHGMKEINRKTNFLLPGFNYRISEIASVLGLSQLRKIETIIRKRDRLYNVYRKVVSRVNGVSVIPVIPDKHNRSVHQTFVAKIDKEINIFELIRFLKYRGIESTVSSTAVHRQLYYKKSYCYKEKKLKNSFVASKKSIALPFHCRMKERDFYKVSRTLKEYLDKKQSSKNRKRDA